MDADNTVTIRSGGSTTLSGAVLTADTVKADVGGNLSITSLQDTSTSTSRQSGGGFDVSLCVIWCAGTPVTGSVSDNTAKGNGSYASVTEQTGIQAGDGGSQVTVAGSTNLVGGVIASTQGAVDAGVNTFATGSLTTSNIVNYDIGSGRGYSLNASYSGSQSNGLSQDGTPTTSSGIGGGYGFGSAGGSQTSVTTAGISGSGGNTAVRTGDSSNGLTQQYADAGALLSEVQTQVQITSAFTNTFGPVVADAAVSWLTALFAPTGVTAVPTPGNPTPAATELVQGDQATRQGFATIQGDPTLSPDLKTFVLDLKTIYDNDAFVQDAVHQAATDPLAYQMGLTGTDQSNPAVKVIFPAVAAAGAESSAAARGAVASLASAVATGGLKYDPVSDTYTSASGGVATGAFVRALSNVSGTAIGLLDAGTAALVSALQTQLPFLGKLVVVVTAVAMNAANGDGSSGSGPTGGNQADTYGTPPSGATPPPSGDNDKSVSSKDLDFGGVSRHSGARLEAKGIAVEEAELAVREDVDRRIANGSFETSSQKSISYQTNVNGVQIEYRVIRLSNGRLNVGTIFPK